MQRLSNDENAGGTSSMRAFALDWLFATIALSAQILSI
jgi:hypothetical protein